jgi:hypothetical protein
VKDQTLVSGTAQVKHNAVISEHAAVIGGVVQDQAQVKALTLIEGNSTVIGGDTMVATVMNSLNGYQVSGSAQLLGDMELKTSVSKGVFYGFVDAAIATDNTYGAQRTQPMPEVTAPILD